MNFKNITLDAIVGNTLQVFVGGVVGLAVGVTGFAFFNAPPSTIYYTITAGGLVKPAYWALFSRGR